MAEVVGMTYLDEACGQTESPELYAPDWPTECDECGHPIDDLDAFGCCLNCGVRIEP